MTAIQVMWLRQLKRHWRSKPRLIGSLAQPALFLLALGFGFGPIYAQAGGGDYIQFLAPGIIGMSVLFTAVFSGIDQIWDRQFGFLKETMAAPVPRWQVMVGKTLGGATVATLQGVIVFFLTLAVGFRPVSWMAIPLALAFVFLVALLFTAFGMAIACRMSDMHAFPLIMNFLVMPLFFLSGALFPLKNLPNAMTAVTRVNPLSYGIDALRHTLTGVGHFGLDMDFLVLSAIAAILLLVGTWLFERVEV